MAGRGRRRARKRRPFALAREAGEAWRAEGGDARGKGNRSPSPAKREREGRGPPREATRAKRRPFALAREAGQGGERVRRPHYTVALNCRSRTFSTVIAPPSNPSTGCRMALPRAANQIGSSVVT